MWQQTTDKTKNKQDRIIFKKILSTIKKLKIIITSLPNRPHIVHVRGAFILLHDQKSNLTILLRNEKMITREILSLFFNSDYYNFARCFWNSDILCDIKSYHLKEGEIKLLTIGNRFINNICPSSRAG